MRQSSKTYSLIGHLVIGVVFGALAVLLFFHHSAEAPSQLEYVTSSSTETAALEKSEPQILQIPAISLETRFGSSLGLQPDGSVEVPAGFDEVGWYKFGPTPGEAGPAVILGHIDSVSGPAVFWSLGQLVAGDQINIIRMDGSTARFVVERVEKYPQTDFPTAAVYGDINYAGLRLITCSGTYQKGIQRYTHNTVVYARLAKEGE